MLPDGFRVGHWSDSDGATGCTVVLAPEGTVAAGEVRGGGPGTRESELLSPAANAPGVQAVCFAGGSAFGLAAADGVVRWLEERGAGYSTPAGLVPLVAGAIVYDLTLGDPKARPGPDAGRAACEAARAGEVERGSVGAGTGAAVGKVLGHEAWTKGGLGLASDSIGGARVTALAVVNAVGEVIAEDGAVLAGAWRDGGYVRTVDALKEGFGPPASARESTTLVCLMTDAELDKRAAWLVARAASAGVGRAVQPSATAHDGDLVYCLASGDVEAAPFAISALAADVTAAAIRDAVRSAAGTPVCPSAADRASS
ncbi:MAG TPA: P1 family peptidase [Thermoleophilaceae bacterium]|jgi:L-aminopeptidase/D-esterase-like protein